MINGGSNLVFSTFFGSRLPLRQACQTQTTLRAAKATKTAKGAAEKRLSGPHFTKN